MMTTWGDLLIKIINALFTSKDSLLKQKRDKRDRIAAYFESISNTLIETAREFEKNDRPWDKYREVSYLLNDFFKVVEKTFEDEQKAEMLYRELHGATHSDYLLMGSRERAIVDVITVRPLEARYISEWQNNPVEKLSENDLQIVISNEIKKIKEVAGLFKGISVELKATS